MAGIFFSCENDLEDVDKFNIEDNAPDQLSEDVELIVTDSGKVKYSLKAKIVEDFMELKLKRLKKGFILDMYDEYGEVRSRLSGINGEAYEFDKKMKVTDSVVFQNFTNNQVLYTEELIWDQNQRKIFTSKNVKIIENNDKVLTGVGLISDEEFNDPLIIKPAGDYYLKKKDSTK